MKILHVMQNVDPHSGGPAMVIRRLVREQVRLGHQVTILATTNRKDAHAEGFKEFRQRMLSDPQFHGVEVFLGRSFGSNKPLSTFGFSPESNRWLYRRLADSEQAPDVIHTHEIFYQLNGLASRVALHHGIPYVMMPEGSLDALCLRMQRYWLKQLFLRVYTRPSLQGAAAVIAASEKEEKELHALVPSSRVVMIPHGVDPPLEGWAMAEEEFADRFPQVRGRRVVLCVARVHPIKRIDLLIRAIDVVRKRHPDVLLVVLGQDDGHLATLQTLIGELDVGSHVLFTGFLGGSMKDGAFAHAKLFALVSMHENFGIVVAEAMIRGVPVLVTPEVASHVYVDQSRAGRTVSGNLEAIAEGLVELLAADGTEMGGRGKEFAASHLCWPEITREIDNVYKMAIENRQKSIAPDQGATT